MPSQDQTSEGKFHEWSKSLVVKKTRLVFSKFLSRCFLMVGGILLCDHMVR